MFVAELRLQACTGFFPDKNWQFIKAHTYGHGARDIRQKGVTRNYNTKPHEKLHGLLKDIYQNRTNFKNVGEQVDVIDVFWDRVEAYTILDCQNWASLARCHSYSWPNRCLGWLPDINFGRPKKPLSKISLRRYHSCIPPTPAHIFRPWEWACTWSCLYQLPHSFRNIYSSLASTWNWVRVLGRAVSYYPSRPQSTIEQRNFTMITDQWRLFRSRLLNLSSSYTGHKWAGGT